MDTKARILLVEDDLDQLNLYNAFLEPKFDVIPTDSAEVALKADWKKYDVIVLDYMLPGTDGHDIVLHKMREMGEQQIPPVLVFSMLPLDFLRKKFADIRSDKVTCLSKSGQMSEVIAALTQLAVAAC